MNDLSWLVGHRFQLLTKREFDWTIDFEGDAYLCVSCLWRLVENGRIVVTSNDDGHKFGLPTPVDAAGLVNTRLTDATVEQVELSDGTLDLRLRFRGGLELQILPDSCGYEAWELGHAKERFIACGGGKLTTLRVGPAGKP
jgi:hypothetical protein